MHPNTTIAYDHCFMTGNKENITALYTDIQAAFDKAIQRSKLNPTKNDGIYKMTFTAVDIVKRSHSIEKGGR